MAGHRPHERPLLPFGTKGGIHRPEAAVGRGIGAGMHRPTGDLGRDLQCRGLVGALHGLGDEDDVYIGDVVQLPTAGLAHADDGEPAGLTVLAELVDGNAHGPLEGGPGEVGDGPGDVGELEDGVVRGDITGGDAEQLTAVPDPERVLRFKISVVGDLLEERLGALLG